MRRCCTSWPLSPSALSTAGGMGVGRSRSHASVIRSPSIAGKAKVCGFPSAPGAVNATVCQGLREAAGWVFRNRASGRRIASDSPRCPAASEGNRHCVPTARATRKPAATAKAISAAPLPIARLRGAGTRRRRCAGADDRANGLLPGLRFEKRHRAAAPAVRLAVQAAKQFAAILLVQFSIDQQVEPPVAPVVHRRILAWIHGSASVTSIRVSLCRKRPRARCKRASTADSLAPSRSANCR